MYLVTPLLYRSIVTFVINNSATRKAMSTWFPRKRVTFHLDWILITDISIVYTVRRCTFAYVNNFFDDEILVPQNSISLKKKVSGLLYSYEHLNEATLKTTRYVDSNKHFIFVSIHVWVLFMDLTTFLYYTVIYITLYSLRTIGREGLQQFPSPVTL